MIILFRMRNEKRELNDIKFEFLPDRDSAEGIAGELVGAGLVHAKDQNAGKGKGRRVGLVHTDDQNPGNGKSSDTTRIEKGAPFQLVLRPSQLDLRPS